MIFSKQGVPVLAAALLLVAISACHQPTANSARLPIAGATFLGDRGHPTKVFELSSDGRAAVGYIFDGNKPDNSIPVGGVNPRHSFYWTEAGGLKLIKTATGEDVDVRAISADGLVAVGRFYDAGDRAHVFRWTLGGGLEDLGAPDGRPAYGCQACGATATTVSADGSVIYGHLLNYSSFRWTRATGTRDLHIPGEVETASADGSSAIGIRYVDAGDDQAFDHLFLWTKREGFKDLGTPAGTASKAEFDVLRPSAISADGSTIVGVFTPDKGETRSFRWKRGKGFQTLPDSDICCLSGDGSRAVGALLEPGRREQTVSWVGGAPPRPIDVPGVAIRFLTAISANGQVISGMTAVDGEPHAFLAHLR